jgi:hypothetical protein
MSPPVTPCWRIRVGSTQLSHLATPRYREADASRSPLLHQREPLVSA